MQYLSFVVQALGLPAALAGMRPDDIPADAAVPLPGWRALPYPKGGELRYRPPLVTDRDYPAEARDAGVEGTTLLRLEVDPKGQIVACGVERSAGLAELDEAACRIYRSRARFQLRNIPEKIILRAPVIWRLETAPNDRKGP